MVKTQFDKNISRIRTNYGSEFRSLRSQHMFVFYKNQGILLETSFPYTPQQNYIVEQKHQHLLDITSESIFKPH